MADKTMLNFRCPAELLDAIDALGQERYPSNSSHGCDRTKTLLDIVRAGIEALSDGSVVLPASDSSVIHSKTLEAIDIEARFVAIEERLGKIECLSHSPELLKPNAGVTDSELQIGLGNSEYDHALTTPDEALADARIFGFTPEEALADAHFRYNMLEANYDELEDRFEAKKRELEELRLQLATERADREEIETQLADLKQNSATVSDLFDKVSKLTSLFKSLLPKNVKLPKGTIFEIEKILGGNNDGN